MSQTPEGKFWQALRRAMPKDWTAQRIENRTGGGVPDVYVNARGLPFWAELKVKKNSRVHLRPHQIAWHTSQNRKYGLSFFLVQHLETRHVYLVRGSQALDLATKSLSEVQCSRFEALGPLFQEIETIAWDHYHELIVGRCR